MFAGEREARLAASNEKLEDCEDQDDIEWSLGQCRCQMNLGTVPVCKY